MKTAYEFKTIILSRAGVAGPQEFCQLSPNHYKFWRKVNALWIESGVNPEEVANVDKATYLSEQAWEQLIAEFEAL